MEASTEAADAWAAGTDVPAEGMRGLVRAGAVAAAVLLSRMCRRGTRVVAVEGATELSEQAEGA